MVCVSTGTQATASLGRGTVLLEVTRVTTPMPDQTEICYRVTNLSGVPLTDLVIGVCPGSAECTIPPLPERIITGTPISPCTGPSPAVAYPAQAFGLCGMRAMFPSPLESGLCTEFCVTMATTNTTTVPWLAVAGAVQSDRCTIIGFDCPVPPAPPRGITWPELASEVTV